MLQVILEYRQSVYFPALLLVTLAAYWKGAGPERAVASVLLGMIITDRAYHAVFDVGTNLASIDVAHALIDLAVAIAFLIIGLTANRMYTLWIAALQLIALNAHLAREMTEAMTPIVYAILYIAPSYFQILTLGIGVWLHHKRLKKFGTYKAWRVSWRLLPGMRRRP